MVTKYGEILNGHPPTSLGEAGVNEGVGWGKKYRGKIYVVTVMTNNQMILKM